MFRIYPRQVINNKRAQRDLCLQTLGGGLSCASRVSVSCLKARAESASAGDVARDNQPAPAPALKLRCCVRTVL